jgi:hypothetical protein
MNIPSALCAASLALAFAAPLQAQEKAAPAAPAKAAERGEPNEPNVRQTVLEDDGSRIEETRIRGNTQRIVVKPKVGTQKSYEIITSDGSRDLSDGVNTSRGAAGKRVWQVLSF